MLSNLSFHGDTRDGIAESHFIFTAVTLFLKNSVELRNGERATLMHLNKNHIHAMLELQEKETTGNTVKRSEETLRKLFAEGDNFAAFGMFNQSGKLIAQATLRLNVELPEILTGKFNAAAKHSTVGCVMVDPAYQGQGIAPVLIQKCLDESREHGTDYAHARIIAGEKEGETANPASMHNFKNKFNFDVTARGQSPESKTPRIVDFLTLKLN